MNAGTVVFVITVLVVIAATTVIVLRRPRRGVELEPPKAPPARPVSPPRPDVLAPPAEPDVLAPPRPEVEPEPQPVPEGIAPVKPSFRDRLAKARSAFSGAFGSVLSRSKIDDDTWDDLEEALLRADVGVRPTTELLDAVRARVKDEGITDPEALLDALKGEMKS